MPKIDEINASFEEIDTNQDGKIDKYEFQKWVSSTEGVVTSSTYETSTHDIYLNDNSNSRFDRNRHHEISTNDIYLNDNSTSQFDRNRHHEISTNDIYLNDNRTSQFDRNRHHEISTSDIYLNDNSNSRFDRNRYATYGTVAVASDMTNETVIETSSLEETNRYLERAVNIYKDPDPLIIRKTTMERPVTYQQRVLVRYLQPPDVPPPGPLIIKEVHAPQPAPPTSLCIHQYAPTPPSPAPLILRERPPIPPPIIPSETIIRQVAAPLPPPRSVVIERFPPLPDKPRDIIIERWLPYGPPPERRTIIEKASSAITYAEPRNKIIIYEGLEARVVRQFEKDGVIREDPANYVARYGNSLLDSATLIQLARNAGVLEDLSPSALPYSNVRGSTLDYESSSGGRYLHDKQYISSKSSRRQGLFDFFQYGLLPADYTPGMKLYQKFVRPANFSFPASSMWSIRTAKYKAQLVDDRITSVTVELLEDGVRVHFRTITEQEYKNATVSSSAPKLAWNDFLQVLQVFMLGNHQEQESDIKLIFDILDQGRRGLYDRTVSLSDGLISPDEMRAFLSILTDEYRVELCVFLADTDGSGQISLSEFTRMVKSGLARDIICECI